MLAKIRTDVFNNIFLTYIEEDDDFKGMSNKEYFKNELENVGYNELFDWDSSLLKDFELKPNREYLISWKIIKVSRIYEDMEAEYIPTIYKIQELPNIL